MITDPFFYLCAIPAILLYGMAKGGFGGGIAVISVPLMTLAISPVTAAAILLPILVAMDFVAIWSFRGQWSRINIKYTLPGAIAGIVVGAFTFRYLSEDAIRIMIGLISVAFCLDYWFKRKSTVKREPNALRGTFWGSIAGFTSFGIHAGGPPISVYMLPQQLEKTLLMGTFAVFFTVVNLVKVIPYAWLGQFDHSNLMTSLVLIPLAPIGVRLGFYCLHKVSEQLIYRLCYFFLMVVGVKLLWEGVGNLVVAGG
ncbi:sulfite exporter TauE/SafE family protein [Aestuariicella hydrocarbonica]|uniref:Probable membrane transporter protein n=1 Tax=Pseudomaricurvus hydrocarbonicus TaxID=1470433 RepID=A0A9E5MQM7_9GAMM|nr:sulfite exporter TauE/SafE family protein [Aestuariicella hydrocarbonica]NHO68527.1 sulfite exporter TauE/SafE family protein [Aestuariicella hydrocarbonica]